MPAELADEPTQRSRTPTGGKIMVGDRYEILPDAPAPEFDQPGGSAFVARDKRLPMRLLVARICKSDVLPRLDTMMQLKRQLDIQVMQPVKWAQVFWPAERRHTFAIIFERPEVGPLMPSLSARIKPVPADTIIREILAPMALTLALFVRHGQTNRAIRPDNMYMESVHGGRVILGDCVSTPPGWGQPVAAEPIEMGMTPPPARGRGSVADDLYSLGASILFLALGFCPVAKMKDSEMLEAKVRNGSFAALLNGQSPPPGLREPLRGLLADNPSDRWKIDDIERWLSGDIRRSVQPIRELSADRVFEFAGREYRECRALAHAFGENWQAAGRVARSQELENWVYRGVSDARLTESMKEIMFLSQRSAEMVGEGRLVSQICMVLDPWGPIRYNGLKSMPDGLGWALVHAVMSGRDDMIQLIAEVIAKGLPADWFRYRSAQTKEDFTFSVRAFKRLQQLLKPAGPGYGIERCLYELSPFAPCMSAALGGKLVYVIKELLPALEKVVESKGKLPTLLDRHVAAFIAARIGAQVENQLAVLEQTKGDVLKAKLGMISLFAKLQQEYGPEHVPHLTEWLAKEIAPAVDRFQSRSMRDHMKRLIESVAVKGSVIELHKAVNSEALIKQDEARRSAAAREYARAETDINQLESREYQQMAQQSGWNIASGISAAIAFLTIFALMVA